MRTFDVSIQVSEIIKQKTQCRIPERLKMQSDHLLTCVGDVVMKLTRFIGNSIHFITALTTIDFIVTEGYRILGTYRMFIKPVVNGTRVTVCDVATRTFIPNIGFVVNLPKQERQAISS